MSDIKTKDLKPKSVKALDKTIAWTERIKDPIVYANEKSKDAVRDFYDLPMYTSGTISHLAQERNRLQSFGGRQYQVVRQLICSPAVTPHQSDRINQFISSLVREDKALVGFGTLHPDNAHAAEQLASFRELGLRGVKLHSDFQGFDIDDPKAYPIYEEASRLGLPVLFHMGDRRLSHSHPEADSLIQVRFPIRLLQPNAWEEVLFGEKP